MFGATKRKEKKEEKRTNKALEELQKNRTKIEAKVVKNLSKKLDKGETITGIVAYGTANTYIAKTTNDRFFVGGVQHGIKVMETILTRDKIMNVSKSGLMPANINLELINGSIRIIAEGNIYKVDKLYMDIVNLVG